MQVILDALLVGSVKPFSSDAVSAIDKQVIAGPMRLERDGLVGDRQADRRVHGGPDKAVHHYPFEHYAAWISELGERDLLAAAGAFGENFSTVGLVEENVAVGDVFLVGSAVLEVSQSRTPCWKLCHRFQIGDMAARVQLSGRTGWYYRVIEEGIVRRGDEFVCLDRRMPDWPLRRLWDLLFSKAPDRDELTAAMAVLPALTEDWQRLALHRLSTAQPKRS